MFTNEQITLIRQIITNEKIALQTSLIQGYTSHPDDFQERKDRIKVIDDAINVFDSMINFS